MLRQLKRARLLVLEKGQGLVEYALLLSLVSVIAIAGVSMFGQEVRDSYCQIVYSIEPNAKVPFCEQINVSCNILSNNPFRMSAGVTDNAGSDDITRVQFFVDGGLYNTELYYQYCLQNGDGPCADYTGPKGTHEFSATAFDADGNTGSCSITATVP